VALKGQGLESRGTDVDGCKRMWMHVDGCGRMWMDVGCSVESLGVKG